MPLEVVNDPDCIEVAEERCFAYKAAQEILDSIRACLRDTAFCTVGLSGGSTPKATLLLCDKLASAAEYRDIPWSRVKFFLVDERYVPAVHEDSNQGMIASQMPTILGQLVPKDNVLWPNTALGSPARTAEDYDTRLRAFLGAAPPYLVLLGLGPDGHIASWFPPLTAEDNAVAHGAWAAHTQQDRFAIKDRITISLDLIKRGKRKILLLHGAPKICKYKSILATVNKQAMHEEPLLQVLNTGNLMVICHPPLKSELSNVGSPKSPEPVPVPVSHVSVVVFGASGDLAAKKTLPSIYKLFADGYLPHNIHVIGYARTEMTTADFWKRHVQPAIKQFGTCSIVHGVAAGEGEAEICGFNADFRQRVSYVSGPYSSEGGVVAAAGLRGAAGGTMAALQCELEAVERAAGADVCNRLFYLALPPGLFAEVCKAVRTMCWSNTGWNRVVIEKPFGKDSQTSAELSKQLTSVLKEEEIFRIDHYLGKEMSLNILSMRFANTVFAPLWNRESISCVKITFKETAGIGNRGGYFDNYGIIRDVIQNHLLQVLSLLTMERPVTVDDEDVRNEKVKVLRHVKPLTLANTVVGQYVGYLNEQKVAPQSAAATFASCILYIDNERWQGVPFILKAGKALEQNLVEIRMQLRPVPSQLFFLNTDMQTGTDDHVPLPQNEIVFKIQPKESIYIKVLSNKPGAISSQGLEQTELDFDIRDRFSVEHMPDAYERLLYEVICGKKSNFVRSDELHEAWRIFTPLLCALDAVTPELYEVASRGPSRAYELERSAGYVYSRGYAWKGL